MVIQTDPDVFSSSLPVYTVTSIQGDVVSLSGSDDATRKALIVYFQTFSTDDQQ
jgi:hypothetical protein